MVTQTPDQLVEPKIQPKEVLKIDDPDFCRDNVCIVTGVGTGIGRATAIAAAANHLTVVGLDIDDAQGRRTCQMVEESGGRMIFIETDLTRDEAIDYAMATAAQKGQIKYLINVAGIQHIDSIENFPMEKYDLMQRLMLRTPFLLSKLTIDHIKKGESGTGVIGHMASVHAHICTAKKSVYNITKFGLRALSQSIAAEGEGKIRSFTVSTGFVKTPLALNQVPAQAEQRGISPQEVVSKVMLGKSRVKEMMSPIDVANIFVFGLSTHARYLIGGDLLFDGGMVLTY